MDFGRLRCAWRRGEGNQDRLSKETESGREETLRSVKGFVKSDEVGEAVQTGKVEKTCFTRRARLVGNVLLQDGSRAGWGGSGREAAESRS